MAERLPLLNAHDRPSQPSACYCFSSCTASEAMQLRDGAPTITNASSPWFAYLQAVYADDNVPLPFDTSKLQFFYHPDPVWQRRHQSLHWPMARCTCYADAKRGVQLFHNGQEYCGKMQNQHPCNEDVCAPWEVQPKPKRRSQSLRVHTNIEGQFALYVFSHKTAVREGSVGARSLNTTERAFESAGSLVHFTIANGTQTDAFGGWETNGKWVEVFRTNEDQFAFLDYNQSANQLQYIRWPWREGKNYYGCWMFHAPGSGIFVNAGRTHHAGGHGHVIDPAFPREDLIGPFLESVNLRPPVVPDRTSVRPPIGFVKQPPPLLAAAMNYSTAPLSLDVQAALKYYDAHSSGAAATFKEHFPIFAYMLGLDSVQFRASIIKMSELVITSKACMVSQKPLRTCPPVPLRMGWNASHECRCADSSLILNCYHEHGAHESEL